MTLIQELERAKEGSRELSDKVLLACGWEREAGGTTNNNVIFWRAPGSHWIAAGGGLPSPTENLQDVLRMLPSGWAGEVTVSLANRPQKANLWNGKFAPCSKETEGHGATPALALCIAALKAREHQKAKDSVTSS